MGDQVAESSESYAVKQNREYKTQAYWEKRFQVESEYEWLVSYAQVRPVLAPYLEDMRASKVLVVGCGNSRFSEELANDGVKSVCSIDFSSQVIERMQMRYKERSDLEWHLMDMTKMTFDASSFDYIIDKAAMDALVTDEGDPWNPNEETRQATHAMMQSVWRTLKPGGHFLQISFQQPHFRRKYLLCEGLSEPTVQEIDHGMGYFFFHSVKL